MFSKMENLYLDLQKWDVIEKLLPSLKSGILELGTDYRMRRQSQVPEFDPVWLFTRNGDRDCVLYHSICFGQYGFIHSRCHNCWKIVAAPSTVKELIQLFDLQRELNFPSKCGTETARLNSSKLYAGYWYTNSEQEGRERYEIVRKAIDEKISPNMPLILKRACTEFEQELGDSKEWAIPKEQVEQEHILSEVMEPHLRQFTQSYHLQCHVLRTWLHKAYQCGDETYKEFTGGAPLFRNLRTYHDKENDNA